jgi:type I restriction enzyme R subunit
VHTPKEKRKALTSEGESQRPPRLDIKLADGKAQSIQHMSSTGFWSPDGRPMSAAQFIESLFGVLPALFEDEDELRRVWSDPSMRPPWLERVQSP